MKFEYVPGCHTHDHFSEGGYWVHDTLTLYIVKLVTFLANTAKSILSDLIIYDLLKDSTVCTWWKSI